MVLVISKFKENFGGHSQYGEKKNGKQDFWKEDKTGLFSLDK